MKPSIGGGLLRAILRWPQRPWGVGSSPPRFNTPNWPLRMRLRPQLRELAEIVGRLAPEHGRSTYGEPDRGRTPWEIYTHREAESILGDAERAVIIMRRLLGELLG